MKTLEIRSTKNSQKWAVAVPAIMFVIMSSLFGGASVGVGAGLVVIIAGIIFREKITHYVENPKVRLTLSDSGLMCMHLGKSILIPWNEIQETGLTYGGKGGPRLNIRVSDSSKYLGAFMRINMSLSQFHISVAVGDLELAPGEIERRIYAARKGDA